MNRTELKMLQALPLDIKVKRTERRIEEWISYHGLDKCYLSFSGGIDSVVLLHIIKKRMNINIDTVFANTRQERMEIVNFIKTLPGITWIKPNMDIKEIITQYGYPVLSKETSLKIYKLRNYNLDPKYRNYLLNGDERGKYGKLAEKYKYLLNADFMISNICCKKLKKDTFRNYEKKNKKIAPITGELADEGQSRTDEYLRFGCNAFNRKSGFKSTPLAFWTKNDILQYVCENKLEYASCYGEIVIDSYKTLPSGKKIPNYKTTKESRTGCVACAFGVQFEKSDNNRFIRYKQDNPKHYEYIMGGGKYNDKGLWVPSEKGLGFNHVLNYLGIPH